MKFTYDLFETDWGRVAAVWSDKGLWELSFPRPSAEDALRGLTTDITQAEQYDLSAGQLRIELNMYLRGFAEPFSIPVDWRGYTPFQASILKCTAAIPYGQTLSYRAVAELAGSPKAARAAGGALNSNRTPIVVPCHRVIGADGSLTGFGGGLDMKKALLLLEKTLQMTCPARYNIFCDMYNKGGQCGVRFSPPHSHKRNCAFHGIPTAGYFC